MPILQDILQLTYFGNTVKQYAISAGVIVGGIILITIIKAIVISRIESFAEKTETTVDEFLARIIRRTVIPIAFFFLIYYSTTNILKVTESVGKALHVFFILGITFFSIRLGTSSIKYMMTRYLSGKGERDEEDIKRNVRSVSTLINIVVWSIGVIFLLDNLGFEISAVVAGLGIGGVAMALASQSILGDLFSYFVIFFDRPIKIGDFIMVDDKLGTVDRIGIKTTRIKSLRGELLVFSNTDLTNSRVHNFKEMASRRVAFKFGVVYQTPAAKMKQIPGMVKDIIEITEFATFDRAHFYEYGDSSLNFEVVYYVEGPDYNRYMDVQQAIVMGIFEAFEKNGIVFAYPTRTVYIEK